MNIFAICVKSFKYAMFNVHLKKKYNRYIVIADLLCIESKLCNRIEIYGHISFVKKDA